MLRVVDDGHDLPAALAHQVHLHPIGTALEDARGQHVVLPGWRGVAAQLCEQVVERHAGHEDDAAPVVHASRGNVYRSAVGARYVEPPHEHLAAEHGGTFGGGVGVEVDAEKPLPAGELTRQPALGGMDVDRPACQRRRLEARRMHDGRRLHRECRRHQDGRHPGALSH
jgi:hypothetical protein